MLPVWRWRPVSVGLLVFALDFGAIMFIRIVIENQLYLSRWWSFRVGDSVFLPLYAAFAAVIINRQADRLSGLAARPWYHVFLLVFGVVLSILIEVDAIHAGRDPRITWLPSQLWHTAIFGLVFYLVFWSFTAILQVRAPKWAFITALVFLLGYFATITYDIVHYRTPEKIEDRQGVPVRGGRNDN